MNTQNVSDRTARGFTALYEMKMTRIYWASLWLRVLENGEKTERG
jgi:hypothetical protein